MNATTLRIIREIYNNKLVRSLRRGVIMTYEDAVLGIDAPTEVGQVYSISVTDFTKDNVVFDSGYQIGRSWSDIPMTGTSDAPEGTGIEIRAVAVVGDNTATTPYTVAATVQNDGTWSAVCPQVPLTPYTKFVIQVRLQGSNFTATTSNRFAVGHILMVKGQSEDATMATPSYDNTVKPSVTNDSNLQVVYASRSASEGEADTTADLDRRHITQANLDDNTGTNQYVTSGMAHMSNALEDACPGVEFLLIYNVKGGTTYVGSGGSSASDDAQTGRLFSVDLAIVNFALSEAGQKIGIVLSSWYAAPRSHTEDWGLIYAAYFLGRNLDGTAFTTPNTITKGSSTYIVDHTMAEYIDYTYTKFVIQDTHVFVPNTDMDNAINDAGSTTPNALDLIDRVRDSARDLVQNPDLSTYFLDGGLSFGFAAYRNGRDSINPSSPDPLNYDVTDHPHPSGYGDDDGIPKRAKLWATSFSRATGNLDFDLPIIDESAFEENLAYLELGSSLGDISTTRLAEGGTLPPATHPHHTQVLGFEINSAPADNVQIVNGKIRVYPLNSESAFLTTDSITFRKGGGSGMLLEDEDIFNNRHKDLPILLIPDLPSGLHGLALMPKPDPALLEVPANFFSISETGPTFQSPTNIPSGTNRVLLYANTQLDAANTANVYIAAFSGIKFKFEHLNNNNNIRVTLSDSNNTSVLSTTTVATGIVRGNFYEFLIDIDYSTDTLTVYVDGTPTQVGGFPFSTASSGFAPTNRYVCFGGREAVASTFYPAVGQVDKFGVWYNQAPVNDNGSMVPPADNLADEVITAIDGDWVQRYTP